MSITTKLTVAAVASMMAMGLSAKDATGLKVYINPGHGGHDAGDRNVAVWPYAQGDTLGYWESNSNLAKGLYLRDMLQAKGYQVEMSRIFNRPEDDLGLSTIVARSNASGADIFFSIHSNATGTVNRCNFPLMLYRGYDGKPEVGNSLQLATILDKHLLDNQATVWTSTNPNIRGDFSFYPSWNGAGLGALRGQKITSMLSEGSFHDYIPETYRLLNNDFCWLEAWHFRKATDEYFGVDGLTVGVVCGRINDNHVPRQGDYRMFGDDKMATVQGATVELVNEAGTVIDTYTTDPVLPNGFYLFKNVAPGNYTVRASVSTHYPAQQAVTVTADEVSYANLQMAKIRNTAPEVVSYSPVWKDGDEAVLCNTPIVINFNWDMDTESVEKAFSINPPVEGTITWSDINYTMTFTPNGPYNRSTDYTVTIGTGAKHPDNIAMAQPFTMHFMTSNRDYMQVLGSYPKDGDEVHYQNATIEFRFDKKPNTTPILKQLSCTDSKGNAVKLNTRQLKSSKSTDPYGFFRVPFLNDLTIGETYNLKLSSDFADKEGITIPAEYDLTFKAVNAPDKEQNKVVVAEMDDPTVFSYDEAGSTQVAAASVAKASTHLFGDAATSFTYQFSGDENGEARYALDPLHNDQTVKPETNIGLQLNGDLTGNSVFLELSSETLVQYVKVADMDFLGWRYIEVPATVDGEAHLTAVKVSQEPSQMSHSGAFAIDHITTSGNAGVNDILSNSGEYTVSHTPGSDYIVANGPSLIVGMELIGLNGASVTKVGGNVINVSDTVAGTYLVRVTTGAGSFVRKVTI